MVQKVMKTLCIAVATYALLVTSLVQAQSMLTCHTREVVRNGTSQPVGMQPANQ